MATPAVMVNLRLPPEEHDRIKAAAYEAHTSVTRWIIEAIREKLNSHD